MQGAVDECFGKNVLMKSLFDSIVDEYAAKTDVERLNALHEVMQQFALAGLARGGFFDKAAFYGGTALHLFYDLPRFSEDLDFSLLGEDSAFRFEDYFDAIRDEFSLAGKDVSIEIKHKAGGLTAIESAFLKESSAVFDIGFTTQKRVKVKLEIDVKPPLALATEEKLLVQPTSCWVKAFSLDCLLAGKANAALFRAWRSRAKGRDWFDLEWYVRKGAAINLRHLAERGSVSSPETDLSSSDAAKAAFLRRIDQIDFVAARDDVRPFVKDASVLDIWSKEYFSALVDKMRFV